MRIAHWPGAAAPAPREQLARARHVGADLLLLPELALRGEDGGAGAMPCDDPRIAALGQDCAEFGVALAFGYVERCPSGIFSALQLIDGKGIARANARVTHFPPGSDEAGLDRGRWLTVAVFGSWRIGLMGGGELLPPEPARALALMDVDLLLHLGAGGLDAAAGAARALLTVRALENGRPVVALEGRDGLAGRDAAGRPLAPDSDGELLWLDLPKADTGIPFERRPELYLALSDVDEETETAAT